MPVHESRRTVLPMQRLRTLVSVQTNRDNVIARLLDHTAWGLVCSGFYVAFCSTDMMIEAQMLDQG